MKKMKVIKVLLLLSSIIIITLLSLSQSLFAGNVSTKITYFNKDAKTVLVHWGTDGWKNPVDTQMESTGDGNFSIDLSVPPQTTINYCFHIKEPKDYWDNNGGKNWSVVSQDDTIQTLTTDPQKTSFTLNYSNKDAKTVILHWGTNGWNNPTDTKMETTGDGNFTATLSVLPQVTINYCYHITTPKDYWDNNGGKNWSVVVPGSTTTPTSSSIPTPTVTVTSSPVVPKAPFSWDNATVYFTIVDRFLNGDTSNDSSYGRDPKDGGDNGKNIGTFHGGDLKGLTKKVEENYFNDLGVNAIWITAPFEQIHGWIGGGEGDFKHYAYHGYYILDYTKLDANMGTTNELKTFIDTAHSKGIRVLFDVVMNHPGYNTIQDMREFNFGKWKGSPLDSNWKPSSSENWHSYNNYIDYKAGTSEWSRWWGANWVRADVVGYPSGGSSETTRNVSYLPDFITESNSSVGLPSILVNKADTKAINIQNASVRTYLVTWLSNWVREYGVDGFRCDTAKNVDLGSWNTLKNESVAALKEWKAKNPTKKMDDKDFWMVGEVFGHGINKSEYYSNGFDAIINFSFQGDVKNGLSDYAGINTVYDNYAKALNKDTSFNALSYISSHDTALFYGGDNTKQKRAGTLLNLTPGAIQIYYGDENSRPGGPQSSDPFQYTRSDMQWPGNTDVLSHWQKVGKFRSNHLAVGVGEHKMISQSPYTFSRTLDTDKVVCVLGVTNKITLDVSGVYANGTQLRDAYSQNTAVVSSGKVTFTPVGGDVLLIEQVID